MKFAGIIEPGVASGIVTYSKYIQGTYIVVSDYGGEYAALQLIAFRPNPGNSAAVINGTTINLTQAGYQKVLDDKFGTGEGEEVL